MKASLTGLALLTQAMKFTARGVGASAGGRRGRSAAARRQLQCQRQQSQRGKTGFHRLLLG